MKWKIPVVWKMKGVKEVEAPTLAEAIAAATAADSLPPETGKYVEKTVEMDSFRLDSIRRIFNRNRPDNFDSMYPELEGYEETPTGFRTELCSFACVSPEELGTYQIVFDLYGDRYYCTCAARSVQEALGRFYEAHPHITYDRIVDHIEV